MLDYDKKRKDDIETQLFADTTNGKAYKLKVSLLKMITDTGSPESIRFLNDLFLAAKDHPCLYDNELIQKLITIK